MKVLIYVKNKGGKPAIYSREKDLKTAKKILSDKYMIAIELLDDEIVDGRDKLSNDGKELRLFNKTYTIVKDQTL